MLIIRVLSSILVLLLLSNCKWFTEARKPMLSLTNISIPDGSPKFKKAFRDGCGTLLYARGSSFYRSRYKFQLDPKLIDDDEYIFGHKRGYNYCFGLAVSNSGYFSGGWDKYLYEHGTPFDMGKGNLDDAYNYGNNFNIIDVGGISGNFDAISGGTNNSVFGSHILWGTRDMESNKIIGW